MIAFTYADNSEAVAKSLGDFQAAIANQEGALQQVADDFREMVAQQFATEGRAEGTPWAPRESARVGADGVRPLRGERRSPLLVRTGALRDSLTRKGATGGIEALDGQTLSIGSRLPYAIFHQLGTRRMPARPLIVLNDARAAKWTGFIRSAIEEKTPLLGMKELGAKQL